MNFLFFESANILLVSELKTTLYKAYLNYINLQLKLPL
jgi:hypothetical protein